MPSKTITFLLLISLCTFQFSAVAGFDNFLSDQKEIWLSPFQSKLKNILLAGGFLALTLILIANDEAIYRHFSSFRDNHKWVQDFSPVITKVGEFEVPVGISALFFLSGMIFKDRKARDTATLALAAMLQSGIVVQLVKHLSGRQRPRIDGTDHWYGPAGFFKRYSQNNFSKYDSFFSGHTITAWSLATVIAEQYREQFWVGLISYSAATLCGLSRVTENDHWLSDVLLGAACGYAIGKMVVRNFNRKKTAIVPMTGINSFGISITIDLGN